MIEYVIKHSEQVKRYYTKEALFANPEVTKKFIKYLNFLSQIPLQCENTEEIISIFVDAAQSPREFDKQKRKWFNEFTRTEIPKVDFSEKLERTKKELEEHTP